MKKVTVFLNWAVLIWLGAHLMLILALPFAAALYALKRPAERWVVRAAILLNLAVISFQVLALKHSREWDGAVMQVLVMTPAALNYHSLKWTPEQPVSQAPQA